MLLAPVDTGRLASSITWAIKSKRGNVHSIGEVGRGAKQTASNRDRVNQPAREHELWIGTNVEYAPYIEYGTIRGKKQSFLRKSLDVFRDDLPKLLREGIRRYYA